MVDWRSPQVLARCAVVFNNVSHFAIGAYIFEWFMSLHFEIDILRKRRPLKPATFLYCYCKWSLVGAFVGMLVSFNNRAPINCQALFTFNQWNGNTAIGASTSLLMHRTIALWRGGQSKWKWPVIVLIGIISLGQWAVLFHGVTTVRASYDGISQTCAVEGTNNLFLNLMYLYTMFTDLIILVLTFVGLLLTPRGHESGLWRMIFKQGVIFFVIAFLANLVPAVMLLIDLNPVMNLMFSIPAVAITATVACRSYVSLMTHGRKDHVRIHPDFAGGAAGDRDEELGKVSSIQWNRTEDFARTRQEQVTTMGSEYGGRRVSAIPLGKVQGPGPYTSNRSLPAKDVRESSTSSLDRSP